MKYFNVLVTGSSGYVASNLIPLLNHTATVVGIDKHMSKYTDIQHSIESSELKHCIKQLAYEDLTIINLAAARFDFGATAKDYYRLNVECHKKFLESLNNTSIKKFVHISSVAALDGRNIDYSASLSCDDAYRSTKNLQEKFIKRWCDDRNIDLVILYPSAVFSDDPRSDTNIGKLQSISKFLTFAPKIDVIKSLTYLPNFSQFVVDAAAKEIPAGKYLTIEKPSLTVSQIISVISGNSIKLVRIPFLAIILKAISYFLFVLGFFGRIDLKLTPNRVVKLFSDTSYSNIIYKDIDTETYTSRNYEKLPEILKKVTKEKING